MLNMSTADNLKEAQEKMPALTVEQILDFEDQWALGHFIDIRQEMWFESLATEDRDESPLISAFGERLITTSEAAREVRINHSTDAIFGFLAAEART
tara:strand:+ start:42 stop:332 length:291 start_codon:yes stop_codon:yes gene_type:complete